MKTSSRRRTTAATTALLLGLTLAACGDDGDDDGGSSEEPTASETTDDTTEPAEPTESTGSTETVAPPPAVVPSEAELQGALLTSADLPAGFVEGEPEDDESDDTFDGTCFGEVGDFEDALGTAPDAEAETEFTLEDAAGQSFVGSKVTAYADPAPVASSFTSFVDTLQECTSVTTTDDDGVTFDLEIAYDETVTVPDADQQVAISMTGTIGSQGQSYDFAYNFVVALTGGLMSIVGASEVGQSDSGVLDSADDFALLQAERLADIVG